MHQTRSSNLFASLANHDAQQIVATDLRRLRWLQPATSGLSRTSASDSVGKQELAMLKRARSTRDMVGTTISVGSRVWVTPFARLYKSHPEFRREFRTVAGRTRTVFGWDETGGVWLGLGRFSVITVDRNLLKVVGQAGVRPRPMPWERPSWPRR